MNSLEPEMNNPERVSPCTRSNGFSRDKVRPDNE